MFQVEKYLKLSVKLVWIVLKNSKAIPPSPIALPVAKASWPRLLPKALEIEANRRKFMTRNFESFTIPSKKQWSCLKARKISFRKGIHYISKHRNSADCQWFGRHLKSPLQISLLFPFRPSFCFTTHILSWFHASPKKKQKKTTLKSFPSLVGLRSQWLSLPTSPPNQHRSSLLPTQTIHSKKGNPWNWP